MLPGLREESGAAGRLPEGCRKAAGRLPEGSREAPGRLAGRVPDAPAKPPEGSPGSRAAPVSLAELGSIRVTAFSIILRSWA